MFLKFTLFTGGPIGDYDVMIGKWLAYTDG